MNSLSTVKEVVKDLDPFGDLHIPHAEDVIKQDRHQIANTLLAEAEGELKKCRHEKHEDHWTHCGYCGQRKSLTDIKQMISRVLKENE